MRHAAHLLFFALACGGDEPKPGAARDTGTTPCAVVEIAHDGVDQDCDGADLLDADGDGVDADFAGGLDCDDSDPEVYPGADDDCYDGIDADCAGDDDFDCDGDGVILSDDCDDADPSVFPGNDEIWYDGVDGDCDGADDFDADFDGYLAPEGGGDDCDDTDASVHPGADEIWYDGVDGNCDGADDFDADGDGALAPEGGGADCDDTDASLDPFDADGDSFSSCDGDCDDAADTTWPGAEEICGDLQDQDCSGVVDDGCPVLGIVGRTYVVRASDLEIREPLVLAGLAAELLTAILIEFDEEEPALHRLHANVTSAIDRGYVTPSPDCSLVVDAGWADFRDNPFLSMGPVPMEFKFDAMVFAADDFVFEGTFTPDATAMTDVRVTALLDMSMIELYFGVDACELGAAIGTPCMACADGREACLFLDAYSERVAWDEDVDITGECGL